MALTLVESQAVSEIAELLYSYLPGQAHPFATQGISFARVANEIGLSDFWVSGSKLPAIAALVENTLIHRRDKFCELILYIVRGGLSYRRRKGEPITREEIERLNLLILKLKIKIPDLWSKDFLDSLPLKEPIITQQTRIYSWDEIKIDFNRIIKLEPQARGYAFERFLIKTFADFGLQPNNSFKIVGEQIDGSFSLDSSTYLLEAKWQEEPVNEADLLIFRGKVEGKAIWARGLFISYSGFTEQGLEAFSKGKATNIIGMTGQDIHLIIDNKIPFNDVIRLKARKAAEVGLFYISVHELNLSK